MSNQQAAKDQYTVTTKFFQAYGGAIDQEATAYINAYAKENNVRLQSVYPSGTTAGHYIFFWVAK
jgi:hypothetical protein